MRTIYGAAALALAAQLLGPGPTWAQGADARPAPGSPTADALPIYEIDPTWPPTLPNDWIFGDIDGVCVIPALLAEKTIGLALEKVAQETTVRQELAAGEMLRTVFARHRIL